MLFAVTVAVATPVASVIADEVAMLAPLAGPVNVTVTPETGFPPASFTNAFNAVANAVLILVL